MAGEREKLFELFEKHIRLVPFDDEHGDERWRVKRESIDTFIDAAVAEFTTKKAAATP